MLDAVTVTTLDFLRFCLVALPTLAMIACTLMVIARAGLARQSDRQFGDFPAGESHFSGPPNAFLFRISSGEGHLGRGGSESACHGPFFKR